MLLFQQVNAWIPNENRKWLEEHSELLDEILVWSLFVYILLLPLPRLGALKSLTRLLPLAIWLLKKITFPDLSFKGRKLLVPCSVYLGACLLSLTRSPEFLYSLDEIRGDVLFPMIICFLIINNISRPEQIRKFFIAFCVSSVIISVSGQILYYMGKGITQDGRANLIFGYPTLAAAYLVPVALLSLGLFFLTDSRWLKTLVWTAFVLNIASLLITQGRTGVAAYLGALIGFLFFVKRKMIFYLLAVILLTGGIMVPQHIHRFFSIIDPQTYTGSKDNTISSRYLIWQMSASLIAEQPISGYGYGHKNILKILRERQTANIKEKVSHTHNLFLQAWIETGIWGVFSLGWILLSVFRQIRHVFSALKDNAAFMALVMALLAFLITAQMNNLMQSPHVKLFWLMIGFIFSLTLQDTQKGKPR